MRQNDHWTFIFREDEGDGVALQPDADAYMSEGRLDCPPALTQGSSHIPYRRLSVELVHVLVRVKLTRG